MESHRLKQLWTTGENDELTIQKALQKAEERAFRRPSKKKTTLKFRSQSNDNQELEQESEVEETFDDNLPRSYLPSPGHRRVLSLTQRKADLLDQLEIKGRYARSVASLIMKAQAKSKAGS